MRIQLIPIDEQGYPAEGVGRLDEVAKQVCHATVSLYRSTRYLPPWIGYLVTHDQQLVGACAFKSPPLHEGADDRVEIGYFTFPQFEGRGIATEMVRELLRLAHASAPQLTIVACTETEENASNAILRKFGFQFIGERNDAENGSVWQWELPPQNRQAGS
jgi:[ribosomal protein S5]-alanine N-acetyltransferase